MVRYKRVSGFGPLKRERWEEVPFDVTLGAGEEASPVSELRIRCMTIPGGLGLQGTLRGQECYFADILPESGKTRATFVMTSVASIELRAQARVSD